MSLRSVWRRSYLPLLGAALLGCSAADPESAESDGTAADGATAPQGGTGAVGGSGVVDSTGATGPAAGGATGDGGTTTGGGGTTSGGTGAETGGVTTGGSTTGGAEAGGSAETGGSAANGGSTETGGSAETAGSAEAGGSAETGGTAETGGSTTGGSTTGGSAETGGSATGGTAETDCTTEGSDFVPTNPPPPSDFTEDQVPGVSFDMVYVPGGTFTLGCESGTCPQYTDPVENITVSSYHIAKNQVTAELYNTVMGGSGSGMGLMINWYDANAFACELSKQTGRAYRMMTEAEFEYAAKTYPSSLGDIGSGEEWAYNSWETSYSCQPGDVDPVGPASGEHTQKTRRDAEGTGDNITGRLIRSIDGIGPQVRLVISDETDYPPGYKPTCQIVPPCMDGEPENSYRDPRWITGDEAHWTTGSIAIGSFDLRVWEDGTASLNGKDGQWFTSNNIAFVFVPSSGSLQRYPYIFLDANQGSVISDQGFMTGFIGRFQKEAASGTKPTITGLQSGAELAAAAGPEYKMVDMVNIPESAKEQDPRLIDGPGQCWFQNNINAGGTHNYRKDVDADEFRFVVIDKGNSTMLANGSWFTVNNTFLRITHSSGYTTDYLYAVDANGYFFHDSYQAYERGDFRMFQIYSNTTGDFPPTCIDDSCSSEIPKGQDASIYAQIGGGESTFVPAPCPAAGCE